MRLITSLSFVIYGVISLQQSLKPMNSQVATAYWASATVLTFFIALWIAMDVLADIKHPIAQMSMSPKST